MLGLAGCLVGALLAATHCEGRRSDDYRIEIRDAEIKTLGTQYLSSKSHLQAIKYNSSVAVLDGQLIFADDLPETITTEVTGYKRLSDGTWCRKFNKVFDRFCTYFDRDNDLFAKIFACVNMNTPCPPRRNSVWAFDHVQLTIPFFEFLSKESAGRWRINVFVSDGRATVIDADLHVDTVMYDAVE